MTKMERAVQSKLFSRKEQKPRTQPVGGKYPGGYAGGEDGHVHNSGTQMFTIQDLTHPQVPSGPRWMDGLAIFIGCVSCKSCKSQKIPNWSFFLQCTLTGGWRLSSDGHLGSLVKGEMGLDSRLYLNYFCVLYSICC